MINRPAGNFVTDELGRDALALRDVVHLFGYLAEAGEMHLRHVGVAGACRLSLAFHDPLGAGLENLKGCVRGKTAGRHGSLWEKDR